MDDFSKVSEGDLYLSGPPEQVLKNEAPLLSIQRLCLIFGGIVALSDVSFDVPKGQICGLIGPNGAGKSSLFNCISQLYRPASGDVLLEGASLRQLRPHAAASAGIGRTFQNVALFNTMSVIDNIMVGGYAHCNHGFLSNALRSPAVVRSEVDVRKAAVELAALTGLHSVLESPVSQLSFGYQKKVEFARALASRPKLLLLDEPAAGLNHEELAELGLLIRRTRDLLGITVLLVEHDMGLVMGISDNVVVLNFGCKIAEGCPATIQNHPEVIRAYLGSDGS